jgi:hypothetical protein
MQFLCGLCVPQCGTRYRQLPEGSCRRKAGNCPPPPAKRSAVGEARPAAVVRAPYVRSTIFFLAVRSKGTENGSRDVRGESSTARPAGRAVPKALLSMTLLAQSCQASFCQAPGRALNRVPFRVLFRDVRLGSGFRYAKSDDRWCETNVFVHFLATTKPL